MILVSQKRPPYNLLLHLLSQDLLKHSIFQAMVILALEIISIITMAMLQSFFKVMASSSFLMIIFIFSSHGCSSWLSRLTYQIYNNVEHIYYHWLLSLYKLCILRLLSSRETCNLSLYGITYHTTTRKVFIGNYVDIYYQLLLPLGLIATIDYLPVESG